MTIASAMIIAVNLLLAICVYVLAATRRRFDAMQFALIGSFLSLAVADLVLGLRGDLDPGRLATIVVLDVMLIVLMVIVLRNSGNRAAELERQRAESAALLEQQRADQALALSDRNSEVF
jgi:hypothetical protein